jgi:hypothetical protein
VYHGGQLIFESSDKALTNDLWRLEYTKGYVKVIPRLEFSDHHPLLICPVNVYHAVAPTQFWFKRDFGFSITIYGWLSRLENKLQSDLSSILKKEESMLFL